MSNTKISMRRSPSWELLWLLLLPLLLCCCIVEEGDNGVEETTIEDWSVSSADETEYHTTTNVRDTTVPPTVIETSVATETTTLPAVTEPPQVQTTAPEADTGFPNEAESNGTKRY